MSFVLSIRSPQKLLYRYISARCDMYNLQLYCHFLLLLAIYESPVSLNQSCPVCVCASLRLHSCINVYCKPRLSTSLPQTIKQLGPLRIVEEAHPITRPLWSYINCGRRSSMSFVSICANHKIIEESANFRNHRSLFARTPIFRWLKNLR